MNIHTLGNMGLNPPLHTKHNECVSDYNEGNTNATIMRLGRTTMKVEFSTHPLMFELIGQKGDISRIGSDTILNFLWRTQSYKIGL
jgi:hypothetical protein